MQRYVKLGLVDKAVTSLKVDFDDSKNLVLHHNSVLGKERKNIHIAPFILCIVSKRSDMDHIVLPANYSMPALSSSAFTRWRHS